VKKIKKNTIKTLGLIAVVLGGFLLLRFSYLIYMKASYPVHYSETVEQMSQKTEIPAELLYAVIRSESGFNPSAVSSVGAKGLMQITPDTLSWVRYRLGEKGATDEEVLFDAQKNIYYGAYTLYFLLKEFGNMETALAAYHAGFGNVTKWLNDTRYSHDGEHLFYIPFGDTSKYVTKVLDTAEIYQTIYNW